MIGHFRMRRGHDRDLPFDASRPPPPMIEELHFDVRVHRRWYPRRGFETGNPRDRIYLEPVPCQPCTWEEILRACEVLSRLQYEQERVVMRREEREEALRMLGRFLRRVGGAA